MAASEWESHRKGFNGHGVLVKYLTSFHIPLASIWSHGPTELQSRMGNEGFSFDEEESLMERRL